jgi:hypothetical protein
VQRRLQLQWTTHAVVSTCEHYAFRQEGLDWQIWIQGDYPLPRKFVIRTLTDDARPQHTSNLV